MKQKCFKNGLETVSQPLLMKHDPKERSKKGPDIETFETILRLYQSHGLHAPPHGGAADAEKLGSRLTPAAGFAQGPF
jgi:hypothetical protein